MYVGKLRPLRGPSNIRSVSPKQKSRRSLRLVGFLTFRNRNRSRGSGRWSCRRRGKAKRRFCRFIAPICNSRIPCGGQRSRRRFHGFHRIGFGRRPLQGTAQAHLVQAVPERGAGSSWITRSGSSREASIRTTHPVPPGRPRAAVWQAPPHSPSVGPDIPAAPPGRGFHARLRRPSAGSQRPRAWMQGPNGVAAVLPRQAILRLPSGPVAFPAPGPRPDVSQQGYAQPSGRMAPFVGHDFAPRRVILPAVLHHIYLTSAEEGHPLPPGGRLHRLEHAKRFGLCTGGVAALEVLADQRIGWSFWSRNCGAFLCGGNAFAPELPPTQLGVFSRKLPVGTATIVWEWRFSLTSSGGSWPYAADGVLTGRPPATVAREYRLTDHCRRPFKARRTRPSHGTYH
ncbi:hypothetical protein AHiyo6_20180 [Arthrobacter sp. Hiyo6]|nr:hypothetical protein AHiyo6_20180 [Arthrobacter sp. Hiyo6]